MKFKVENNGKEIECDIVCTFKDKTNDRNYIIYTDGTKDDVGDSIIYASRYTEKDNSIILEDIENEYEWNLIDNMLKTYGGEDD